MNKSKPTRKKSNKSKKEDIDRLLEQLGDEKTCVKALKTLTAQIDSLPEERREALIDRAIEMTRNLKDSSELRNAAEHLGKLLKRGPDSRRDALIERLIDMLREDLAIEQEGRPRLQAMWQLYESLKLLTEAKREEFIDHVLEMSEDLGPPRHGRAVAEMLGFLFRGGPTKCRERIIHRLIELLESPVVALAIEGLGRALTLLSKEQRTVIADAIIKASEDSDLRATYPEKVVSAFHAIYTEVPSHRDTVLDQLFKWLDTGIDDMRASIILTLIKIADTLPNEKFDLLADYILNKLRAADSQIPTGFGLLAKDDKELIFDRFLDLLNHNKPDVRRDSVRALTLFRDRMSQTRRETVVEHLLMQLHEDRSGIVHDVIPEAIGQLALKFPKQRFPTLVTRLLDEARNAPAWVPGYIIEIMMHIQAELPTSQLKVVVEVLVDLTHHTEGFRQLRAIQALGKFADIIPSSLRKDVIVALQEVCGISSIDPNVSYESLTQATEDALQKFNVLPPKPMKPIEMLTWHGRPISSRKERKLVELFDRMRSARDGFVDGEFTTEYLTLAEALENLPSLALGLRENDKAADAVVAALVAFGRFGSGLVADAHLAALDLAEERPAMMARRLVSWCHDSDKTTRASAVELLAYVSYTVSTNPSFALAITDTFVDLVRDQHWWVCRNAVDGFQGLRESLPRGRSFAVADLLLDLTHNPHTGLRGRATKSLGYLIEVLPKDRHNAVFDRLLELTTEEDNEVRVLAARALSEFSAIVSPERQQIIIARLLELSRDPCVFVRGDIAWALAGLKLKEFGGKSEAIVASIIELLQDPHIWVRDWTGSAVYDFWKTLPEHLQEWAVAQLLQLTRDDRVKVRQEAVENLANFSELPRSCLGKVVKRIKELMQDPKTNLPDSNVYYYGNKLLEKVESNDLEVKK